MRPSHLALLIVAFSLPSLVAGQEAPTTPVRVEEPIAKRTVRIHGTAVAIDKEGQAHADTDGSLQIYHRVDGLIEVPVHAGKWEAWCSIEAKFLAGQLELAGRSVALPRLPFAPPLDRSFDLSGPWIDDHVLHVLDASTGAELTGVEMLRKSDDVGYASHPGVVRPGQEATADLHSPLRLTKFGEWFVRAPNHAWSEYRFFEPKEAEENLELQPACKLVIDASEFDPKGIAKLRVEPGNGSVELLTLDPSIAPWPDAWKSGHIELDALPPGRVHARAYLDFHMKPWFWHTVTLGEAVVTLSPDAPAHAQFVVGPPPAGMHDDGTVDRNGIVTLPDGLERKPFEGSGSFKFEYVKAHEKEKDGGFRGWSGVFEQLPDGTYDMRREYDATIEKGVFHLRPPYGTHLHVTALVLDGRPVDLRRDEALFDTTADPIDLALPGLSIEAPAAGATTLHVIDAETKAELAHVEIVSGLEWPRSDCAHPGKVEPAMVLVRDAVSPVALPAAKSTHGFRGGRIYWVRADGHAWSRFEQDSALAGERTVPLARACELEVRLEPNVVAPGSLIRVRSPPDIEECIEERQEQVDSLDPDALPPGAPSIEALRKNLEEQAAQLKDHPEGLEDAIRGKPLLEVIPDVDGTTALEGLPCGRFVVSVELGKWFREPTRFGSATVDASKGGHLTVTVVLRPPDPAPDPVPLAGTLFIPPEWGKIDATLYIKPESRPNVEFEDWIRIDVSKMKRDSARPGEYAWSPGKVLPGTYELSLDEFGFERKIEVGAEGDVAQRIEIAPPADVIVHLVDAVTNAPAAVRQISWYLAAGSLNSDADVRPTGDDANAATFRFKAPIGSLTIHVWERPYDLHAEDVEIRAGENEFTVKLERECGVRVVLKSGTTTIPWDDEAFKITLRKVGGAGSDRGWGEEENAHRIMVSSPGRYRVTFGRFPGFKSVKPREVTIGRGELVDLTVELEVDR